MHTGGAPTRIPAGTVVVALDQVAGAAGFIAYPAAYAEMELLLVPQHDRDDAAYRAYYLSFRTDQVGAELERIDALSPRPPSRLPRAAADGPTTDPADVHTSGPGWE
jgi:hypothetical protein